MTAVFNFDANILLWIQANLRGGLDGFFTFITHLGDKGLLWIALTLILMFPRKTRRAGVASAIAMVLGLIVTNLILKNLVDKHRPYELINGLTLMIEKQPDSSFPSGHATNSMACSWVLFRTLKKRYSVIALILALLICFSRLYVGVHYPTDVLAGIAIGICAAEFAIALVKTLKRRFPAFRRFINPKLKQRDRVSR